jgi:hypothetical protein
MEMVRSEDGTGYVRIIQKGPKNVRMYTPFHRLSLPFDKVAVAFM